MNKLADLMELHQEELAALDSLDNGKTFGIALGFDVMQCIGTIRYYAGWATKIQGKTITVEGDYEAYTRHEAIGVVGAIVPWNFPLLMACWKIGPCLACGNTLVIKSSEKTPLSLLRLAALTKEAGFPDGVFNVLSGFGPRPATRWPCTWTWTRSRSRARRPWARRSCTRRLTPTSRR